MSKVLFYVFEGPSDRNPYLLHFFVKRNLRQRHIPSTKPHVQIGSQQISWVIIDTNLLPFDKQRGQEVCFDTRTAKRFLLCRRASKEPNIFKMRPSGQLTARYLIAFFLVCPVYVARCAASFERAMYRLVP